MLDDFGIAYGDASRAHKDGKSMAGTLEDMATEPMYGRKVDSRPDLYVPAVLAFERLIGVRPLPPEGNSLAAQVKHPSTTAPTRIRDFWLALAQSPNPPISSVRVRVPRCHPEPAGGVAGGFESLSEIR